MTQQTTIHKSKTRTRVIYRKPKLLEMLRIKVDKEQRKKEREAKASLSLYVRTQFQLYSLVIRSSYLSME
jgi:hypothetical protein